MLIFFFQSSMGAGIVGMVHLLRFGFLSAMAPGQGRGRGTFSSERKMFPVHENHLPRVVLGTAIGWLHLEYEFARAKSSWDGCG